MDERNGQPIDPKGDGEVVEPGAELSEADLECVVGGLARPWTEAEADEWIVESAPSML